MKIKLSVYIKATTAILFFFLTTLTSSYATVYFIAPDGNDVTNNGTSSSTPYFNLSKAVAMAVTGDLINVLPGIYTYSTTITISKSGIAIKGIQDPQGTRPLFNFSSMALSSSNYGIVLSGSNCFIYGIQIQGAGDNGIKIQGNTNKLEYCSFFENRDTGCQIGNGASNNQIINCDSYFNVDASQGNADGFAAKLDVGSGNYFFGCRAWQNSDDAWDGYLRGTNNVFTTLENCWAFKNGFLKSGVKSSGNGNGFKMGGSDNKDLSHNFTLKNCLAFQNKVKGFDQNNNMGSMTLLNCTAFSNGTFNFAIFRDISSSSVATIKNCISFGRKDSLLTYTVLVTDSWMNPFLVDNADFQSLDSIPVYGSRSSDGTLPDIAFMHLAAGSDLIDAGTDVGLPFNSTAPDLGCFETGAVVAVNIPPVVSMTGPADNANYSTAPATVTLTADATDADGMVSHVQFYNGNTLLGIDAISPYTFSWTNVTEGTYTITAVATDNNLAKTTTSVITITVGSPSGVLSLTGMDALSKVYPNPANSEVNIETSFPLLSASLRFLDAFSSEISIPVAISETNARFDVSSLASGVYTLLITQDGSIIRKKIVVMR